jgi:hypothetical protein
MKFLASHALLEGRDLESDPYRDAFRLLARSVVLLGEERRGA